MTETSNNHNPRVFVVPHRSDRYDIRDAGRFGELVELAEGPSPLAPQDFAVHLRQEIDSKGFDPCRDYLCMTAEVLPLAFTLATMSTVFDHPLQLLIYDARKSQYVPKQFYVEE